MSRRRLLGVCLALCGAAAAGTGQQPVDDAVTLMQKAASTAEAKQFPGMFMTNPMTNMINSMSNLFNPMMAFAVPPMRPRAPGFSVIVDRAAGANFKLDQKMTQMGISPDDFFSNTVIIDKYGMRVPQGKVPRFDQYPLVYKYTPSMVVPPTSLSSMAASVPSMRNGAWLGPAANYDGIWHRAADSEDQFEIHGNLMRWSKQPPNTPPMQVNIDASGQITMYLQGILHSGHLDGSRLTWTDGDIWIRDAKAKTVAEQVMDGVMAAMGGGTGKPMLGNRRSRDLAFVNIPCNFGHQIEKAALATPQVSAFPGVFDAPWASTAKPQASAAEEPGKQQKEQLAQLTLGPGGEVWGMMHQALRGQSNVTGCDMYYTPPKYWPEEAVKTYFAYDDKQNRTVAGVLRDPYDKIVNEFRLQVLGVSPFFDGESRADISKREGSAEREGLAHQRWYDTCDVNSWVKEELKKVKDGDAFRANCHFLPQAEYFEGPHAINLPIDGRLMPLSFNEVAERHGYAAVRLNSTWVEMPCGVSSWSLDQQAKDLIKELYARDFELLCLHFGYCDRDELTCMTHVPGMCGGSPHAEM